MTVVVTPANVSAVTGALVAMLADGLKNVRVGRSEEINATPGNCPWVGVYRADVGYEAGPLGFGSGFRIQRIRLVVVAQEAHGSDGTECENLLEELLARVAGLILSDVTLRGTVRVVEELTVNYPSYQKVGGSYMQTGAVYLTATVPVTVNNV